MFPPAGLILLASFFFGAPDAGWTEYPPISLQAPYGTSMWCMAIFLIGISSTLTGINFLVTIFKMRAPGMTFTRMPLFVWASAATAGLNMVATHGARRGAARALPRAPVRRAVLRSDQRRLAASLAAHVLVLLASGRVHHDLAAFGIISEVLPTFSRKPIFGYKMIAFSSVAIALLGFMVWAHHMFTSGMAPWMQLPFMIITMLIAITTGIKIFS